MIEYIISISMIYIMVLRLKPTAGPAILGLGQGATASGWPGIAKRHPVEFPFVGELLETIDYRPGGQVRAEVEIALGFLTGGEDLT